MIAKVVNLNEGTGELLQDNLAWSGKRTHQIELPWIHIRVFCCLPLNERALDFVVEPLELDGASRPPGFLCLYPSPDPHGNAASIHPLFI